MPAQRQGGLGQAVSQVWTRLVEWYPWSLGLLFPLGMLLALCFFPGLVDSEEEEALRAAAQEGEGEGEGKEKEGEEATTTKDAASKKNE